MINCVRYYDNTLDKNKCDEIIKRFEYDTDRHVQTELEGHRYFTELNISAYPDWKDIHNMLVDEMQKFLKYYKHDLSLDDKVWPDELANLVIQLEKTYGLSNLKSVSFFDM